MVKKRVLLNASETVCDHHCKSHDLTTVLLFSFPLVPVMVAWFLFKITLQDLVDCSNPGYLCKPESDPDGGLWLQQQRRG